MVIKNGQMQQRKNQSYFRLRGSSTDWHLLFTHPITGHESPEGEHKYSSTLPSTSAIDGGVWVDNATPRLLYPQERPGIHCRGRWVGHRVGLDGCGKSHPSPGFDPREVPPVATSLYRLSYHGLSDTCCSVVKLLPTVNIEGLLYCVPAPRFGLHGPLPRHPG